MHNAAVERGIHVAGDLFPGEETARRLEEFAVEVLAEGGGEELLLFLDELGVEVFGVFNGGFDAVPVEPVVVPDGVEDAGLATGRAEES